MSASQNKITKTGSSQGFLEQSFQVTPKRIPMKPNFRYVDYENQEWAQQIQVKFWKIHSCNLSRIYLKPPSLAEMLGLVRSNFERKEKLEDILLKHSTTKKSLKYLKRIKFCSKLASSNRFFNKLCKTLKLDTLSLSIMSPGKISTRLEKAIMTSKLKYCLLIYESGTLIHDLDAGLISSFRKLNKSNLFVSIHQNNFKMLLDTNKLLPWTILFRRNQIDFPHISNHPVFVAPNSIKRISYQSDDWKGRNFTFTLPQLPNLQQLSLSWKILANNETSVNLSFIKQYSKLQSLSLKLLDREAETLDFLAGLPCLKELYLHFKQSSVIQRPLTRNFPRLTKLEKFGLFLDEPIRLTFDNLKNLIYKNKDLKSLDLSLTIQNIGLLLKENENLAFPAVEKLRLYFIRCERSDTESMNKIIKTLKRLDSIKQIEIEFAQSFAELNTMLFKEGLAFMKTLESLTLKYHQLGELDLNNFKSFQCIFESLKSLKALDLDFGQDNLSPEEFGPILDGLCGLKHLKKLRLTGEVSSKSSSATFNKFTNYLISIRHLGDLQVSFKGIPEWCSMGLNEKLLPKFPLSQRTFELKTT